MAASTTVVRRMRIPIDGPCRAAQLEAGDAPVVLLASDDGDFRAAAGRVLEGASYDVLHAPHAGHALLASMLAPRLDVLVVDMRLPDSSGPGLTRQLLRRCRDLRVLYLANTEDPITVSPVLQRPFVADDLLAAIEEVLAAPAPEPAS
jgi:FixJ family two-component response regulator